MHPESIAHYRILRKLSSGGMGEVYLAEDPKLGRRVALKMILSGDGEGSQGPIRLIKEAQAAARLDHPNVCAIYEVGEWEGQPYIAMQYIEGETLAAVQQRSRPSLQDVVSWGIQVADALAEAHDHGIIHRDIKPANLILTPKGRVKVLDFGLAKVSTPSGLEETGTLLTTPGLVLGTVPYMSPEQVRGDVLDGRTDLFSLGTVLYEAATGRRPFRSENPAVLMSEVLLKDPFKEDDAAADLPAELRAVLQRALEKDPAKRYPTARALAADLRRAWEHLQGGDPTPWGALHSGTLPGLTAHPSPATGTEVTGLFRSIPPTDPPTTAAVPAPGRRMRAWLLGAGLLGLAIPTTIYAVPRIMARQAALDSIAILPFTNATGDPESDYLADGLTEQLISQLSRLPHLKVISRSSVLHYKGKDLDLQLIARELGVKAVVLGQVRQRAGRLSANVEFVEASDRHLIWGNPEISLSASDLQEVQNGIALEVGQHLGHVLSSEEQQALANGRVHADPEAYQLYLKGRYYADKFTPEDMGRAMAYFDLAIQKDPKFALVHVGKANAYWGMSSTFKAAGEVMPRVKEEAHKALEIDPNLADAHTSLGIAIMTLDHDYAAAEAALRRGVQLNGGSASALSGLGFFLSAMGRKEESYRVLEQAVDLDPQSSNARTFLAIARWFGADYEGALREARVCTRLDPDSWWPRQLAAGCLLFLGRNDEALSEINRAVGSGSPHALAWRGYILARLGKRMPAEQDLATLDQLFSSQKSFVSPYHLALVQIGLGRKQEALEWLQRSAEAKDESAPFMRVDPALAPLRDDPKFRELLRAVRLGE